MAWLEELVEEMVKNLPKGAFADSTFGFGDIQRAIALVEKAAERNAAETTEAGRTEARTAAADPTHSFNEKPIFSRMGVEFWKAETTFPRILRGALLVAIYSHLEYLLLSWCESAASTEAKTLKNRRRGESYLARYLRYLRDEGRINLDDFTTWPEWAAIESYGRARNCLAHRGGVIDSDDDRRAIAGLPNISIGDSGLQMQEAIVHLLPGACEAACEIAKTLIDRVVTSAKAE